jgi:hypothetical protein
MAITNQERFGKALEILNQGMLSFVDLEPKQEFGAKWTDGRPRQHAYLAPD